MLKKIIPFTRSFWVSQPWELIRRQEEEEDFPRLLSVNRKTVYQDMAVKSKPKVDRRRYFVIILVAAIFSTAILYLWVKISKFHLTCTTAIWH